MVARTFAARLRPGVSGPLSRHPGEDILKIFQELLGGPQELGFLVTFKLGNQLFLINDALSLIVDVFLG
jgi:hypothetical protein